MALLSNEQLHTYQAFLGSGYAGLIQCQRCVESGLSLVVASHDVQVELDLLDPFNTNGDTVNISGTVGLLRVATEALERHISNRSGLTFDDYLLTNGLKVGQDFADLSGLLGVTIKPVNIEVP